MMFKKSWILGLVVLLGGCSDATKPTPPPTEIDPEFAKMMEKGGGGGGGDSCTRPSSSAECRYKFLTAVDAFWRAYQGGISWEQFADRYRDYVTTPDGPGFRDPGSSCAPLCYGPMAPGAVHE